jgi:HSP20 family protein
MLTNLFETFFQDWPLRSPLFGDLSSRTENWVPAINILEKEGDLILQAELPGFDEKNIDVKLEQNVLTIKGERTPDKDFEGATYHRMESFCGSFTRSFTLPDTVQADQIKAKYRNGILTIRLPLKAEVRPKMIPVSVN